MNLAIIGVAHSRVNQTQPDSAKQEEEISADAPEAGGKSQSLVLQQEQPKPLPWVALGSIGVLAFVVLGLAANWPEPAISEDTYAPVVPAQDEVGYQDIRPFLGNSPELSQLFEIKDAPLDILQSDGSVSMVTLIREVQRQFPAIDLVYGESNETPGGSNRGIQRLAAGEIDVSFGARIPHSNLCVRE